MTLVDYSLEQFQIFLMILLRTGALLLAAPILGHRTIPTHTKIGLALVTSMVLFPMVSSKTVHLPSHLLSYGVLLVREIVMGLIIGFAALLLFIGVQFAGQMIGLQMGFGVVNVIDPQSAGQISIIAEFQNLIAALIFLTIGGHHFLLEAIATSFDLVPIGTGHFSPMAGQKLIEMGAWIFTAAVKISAPVIATLFILSVALGIIARTVPQMNVFIVGFPVQIGVGLGTMILSLPFFYVVLTKLIQTMQRDIRALLGFFGV